MNRLFIALIILLNISCNAQKSNAKRLDNKHKEKIAEAYKYLINQGKIDNKALVVNSIQKLETEWFIFELHHEESRLGINEFKDSLYKKDKLFRHKEFSYPVQKLLNNKVESSSRIVIFSSTRDDYISAEVYYYEKPVSKYELNDSHYSIMYLFKFDEGVIKDVYSVKIPT